MPKAPDLPRLYPIVDVDVCTRTGWNVVDLARAYLAGGARLLQLRAKTLSGARWFDLASAVRDEAHAAGARLIVNDRVDVALVAMADGVHVGQEDLGSAHVRRLIGDDAIVGLSTHTEAQVEAALVEPISYLAIGPVFPTTTKATGYERVGYDAVRHAAGRAATKSIPVVAIGGITLDTAPLVVEAGARSVAVITDLVTPDPEQRVRDYLAAIR